MIPLKESTKKYRRQREDYLGSRNPNYGKKHPKLNHGETNPMWKGENVSKRALHDWAKYHLVKPEKCEHCNKETTWLDLANCDHEYRRDLNSWLWLCRSCHMIYDYKMGFRK